jgi:hypothetical protein
MRIRVLPCVIALIALPLAACSESEPPAQDADTAAEAAVEADPSSTPSSGRSPASDRTATGAGEASTTIEEREAVGATLREFPNDPRVVFDRSVMTAFRTLRASQRQCGAIADETRRGECMAVAKEVYQASKDEAERVMDEALANAPPSG